MTCTKRITLNGYKVTYYDRREPKPRNMLEEVYIITPEFKNALALLGLDMTDFIRSRYERGGYCCCSIEKIKGSREARIDLRQCWDEAGEADQNVETPESREEPVK